MGENILEPAKRFETGLKCQLPDYLEHVAEAKMKKKSKHIDVLQSTSKPKSNLESSRIIDMYVYRCSPSNLTEFKLFSKAGKKKKVLSEQTF